LNRAERIRFQSDLSQNPITIDQGKQIQENHFRIK
jgi:hypothetical protein